MTGKPWAELPAMMARAGKLDRIELKIQLAAAGRSQDDLADALGVVDRETQARQIYYFDRPDLALYREGIVTRARVKTAGQADLVCKLRLPRSRRLPSSVRRLSRLNLELDALPHHTLWCASVKEQVKATSVRKLCERRRTWSDLCSDEQRLFLRSLLADSLDIDNLRNFGPISVRKLTGRVPKLGELGLESWLFPNGETLVELSTKCRPERAGRVARQVRRLLEAGAVALSPRQGTKTEFALRRRARAT
ncbi:hypothetical protein GCM10023321_78260 [Pseudonocardia eucalypti]|uniref:CYTH domain-containing protein n=1 Tax=Pseudonocardia eucalypti TaxID=648755 RepID=A0ABP9RBR4_9PSEU|nr:hypothetical protein [Pseudonocardia eucalypti]